MTKINQLKKLIDQGLKVFISKISDPQKRLNQHILIFELLNKKGTFTTIGMAKNRYLALIFQYFYCHFNDKVIYPLQKPTRSTKGQ